MLYCFIILYMCCTHFQYTQILYATILDRQYNNITIIHKIIYYIIIIITTIYYNTIYCYIL